MTLRVAINATPLLSPLTGIGNYIVHLGEALAAEGGVELHSFYSMRWRRERPLPQLSHTARGRTSRAVRDAVKPWVPFRRWLRETQQQAVFGLGLRRYGIDLYHEPNYIPLRFDVPVVLTVHDLSWIRFPETHPRDRVRWLEARLPRALERAGAILVDSEFVRQEVLAQFALPEGRVHVVHLGVGDEFRPRSIDETAATLAPLGLTHGSYILSIGTVEPRKNIRHALEAYARLPAAIQSRYPLVIGGAKGWRANDLERELRLQVERGNVRFIGYVSPEALPQLYAGAALFVYPSLYEGFGLPPLEAMASGVPVLVSDRASLPEVVGDAAVLIDPENPAATAVMIESTLEDPVARLAHVRRGLERARRFRWRTCAEKTLNVYRAVAG